MATPWDANSYDATSQPQQSWAGDVLERIQGRLPAERREPFTDAVLARVSVPLDYVRLNVSAVGGG